MTARLNRIHRILREANVPCALGSRPGAGLVLLAGVPDSRTWDVLVQDTGTELLVQDGHGTTRVPISAGDEAAANSVKFHVVQAWAEQGDPEAGALLAKLGGSARHRDRYPSDAPTTVETQYFDLDGLSLFNPLDFAERMLDAMNQFGNLFLSPQPITVNPVTIGYAMWSPWGTIRGRYTI
jgi:hypothetical protein